MNPRHVTAALAIAETRAWVRRAVIGLNLCPFARAVDAKDQIRYVFSDAAYAETLLATLVVELQRLADTDSLFTLQPTTFHSRVGAPSFFSFSMPVNDKLSVAFAMHQFLNFKEDFVLDPRPIRSIRGSPSASPASTRPDRRSRPG